MSQNEQLVKIDLNNPEFQRTWVELEADEAERVRATFKKILKLTWQELYRDKGLHWGKIHSMPAPKGIDSIYSFRLSKSARGVGYRDGNFLRVLLVNADHDGAYGKK